MRVKSGCWAILLYFAIMDEPGNWKLKKNWQSCNAIAHQSGYSLSNIYEADQLIGRYPIKKSNNIVHLFNFKHQRMDLKTRKYNFIQELISIDRTSVLDALERVLKKEKEKEDQISAEQKKELDIRLKSYKDNPKDVLDWENVKNEW